MTHDFNGLTIEKGANWIEGVGGPEENPIIPYAKKLNLVNTVSNFDNITNNIYTAKQVSVNPNSLHIFKTEHRYPLSFLKIDQYID